MPEWASWFEYCAEFHVDPADKDAFDRVDQLTWWRWMAWREARSNSA